jgi:phosphotransferase system, enzyme I, PtsP
MLPEPIRFRIHDRGDVRLDGILRLLAEAAKPRPLGDVLRTLCQELAQVLRVDVASIYVYEPDAVDGGPGLVMRANVGFATEAVGQVRLRVGEGLTGCAAECLRPVTAAVARTDDRYKHFPSLGEEKFPSYLGIPLVLASGLLGVLVLQRRDAIEPGAEEIALAAALAAPVAYALERARAGAEPVPTGGRSARLDGVALSPGTGLGRAEILPSLDSIGAGRDARPVALALATVSRELDKARRQIEQKLDREALSGLRHLAMVLDDNRLRDLILSECVERGLTAGLCKVARDYARAAFRSPAADPWLAERAAEIEDLCVLVGVAATRGRLPDAGTVLVSERLTAMTALLAVGRKATGAAVCSATDVGLAVARAAELPVVGEVPALFSWVRPADRLIVEGDTGHVRVNPTATAVARYRAARRG